MKSTEDLKKKASQAESKQEAGALNPDEELVELSEKELKKVNGGIVTILRIGDSPSGRRTTRTTRG